MMRRGHECQPACRTLEVLPLVHDTRAASIRRVAQRADHSVHHAALPAGAKQSKGAFPCRLAPCFREAAIPALSCSIQRSINPATAAGRDLKPGITLIESDVLPEPSARARGSRDLVWWWAVIGVVLIFGRSVAMLGMRGVMTIRAGLSAAEWTALAVLTVL